MGWLDMVRVRYPEAPASRRHVLRLCSVFEPAGRDVDGPAAAYDPVGGMQNHTASLSRVLDARGVTQTVVTSRLAAPAGTTALGRHGSVRRVGVRTTRLRQLWAPCALPAVLGAALRRRGRGRPAVVHAHRQLDEAGVLGVGR